MNLTTLLLPLITAATGLGGVFLGSRLADRREREKRRADFLARQLAEFYGPMLGLRASIKAHSDLRVKLQVAHQSARTKLVAQARQNGGPPAIERLREGEVGQMFAAMIHQEDSITCALLLPWYQEMVELFREKISLSERDTRAFLPDLIEFVDVWDRFLQGKIPGQVVQELGHAEEKLHPLYDNLQKVHDQLRTEMAGRPSDTNSPNRADREEA